MPIRNTRLSSNLGARDQDNQIITVCRPQGFEFLELHSGSAISQEYPRHWHDELYLCAIVNGVGNLDCFGNSYQTPAGTIVAIPPGEVHANQKHNCTFSCMFIDFEALRDHLEEFTENVVGDTTFRTELIHSANVWTDFLRVHRLLLGSECRLKRQSTVMSFFYSMMRRWKKTSLKDATEGDEGCAVWRTRRFLREHYAEGISLKGLSGLSGLSPYHLHRSFCNKVGMPPHAYLTQLRIHQARVLLKRGISISEVASAVGFVDQSHLSRNFKKLVGMAPGQYARLYRDRARGSN